MKGYTLFSLLLFLFLAVNQSAGSNLPAWILNPDQEYPEEWYITGVGSGSSIEEARQNALSSISNSIMVQVQSNIKMVETYKEKLGGKSEFQHNLDVFSESSVRSENILMNVQFPKTFVDNLNNKYYVLAVIDKKETAPLYMGEIAKNDSISVELYKESSKIKSKIKRLLMLQRCQHTIERGEKLRLIYQVLANEMIPLPISLSKINSEIERLKAATSIKITYQGKYSDAISSCLKDILSDYGFKVVNEQNDSYVLDLHLVCDLKEQSFYKHGNYYYNIWTLNISAEDPYNEYSILKEFSYSGRTVSLSLASLDEKIVRDVKDVIKNKFYTDFRSFLESF